EAHQREQPVAAGRVPDHRQGQRQQHAGPRPAVARERAEGEEVRDQRDEGQRPAPGEEGGQRQQRAGERRRRERAGVRPHLPPHGTRRGPPPPPPPPAPPSAFSPGFLPPPLWFPANPLILPKRPWRSAPTRGPKAEGRPMSRGLLGGGLGGVFRAPPDVLRGR